MSYDSRRAVNVTARQCTQSGENTNTHKVHAALRLVLQHPISIHLVHRLLKLASKRWWLVTNYACSKVYLYAMNERERHDAEADTLQRYGYIIQNKIDCSRRITTLTVLKSLVHFFFWNAQQA